MSGGAAAPELTITSGDQRVDVGPGDVVTIGRAETCTIRLDPDDRGISRQAAAVEQEMGTWWLSNRSAVRPLTLVDDLGIRTVVAPGRRLALLGPMTLVIEGATRRHAFDLRPAHPEPPAQPVGDGAGDTDLLPTSTVDDVMISSQDRLAMVALFSGYLEAFPRYDPHPKSYAEAGARLGWPRTTVVKRIEYLRAKLTDAGVPNLTGEAAMSNLAEWALTTGVLTRGDLALLSRSST